MQTSKVRRERQQRFLAALAMGSHVNVGAAAAGAGDRWLEETRKSGPEFAAEWGRKELSSVDDLELEAWRRAVRGVVEPVISEGKIIRDEDGKPVAQRRYSDDLLLSLLSAYQPDLFRPRKIFEVMVRPRWLQCIFAVLMVCLIAWMIDQIVLSFQLRPGR